MHREKQLSTGSIQANPVVLRGLTNKRLFISPGSPDLIWFQRLHPVIFRVVSFKRGKHLESEFQELV